MHRPSSCVLIRLITETVINFLVSIDFIFRLLLYKIKFEVITTETFSSNGVHEDYKNKELKFEPIDFVQESFSHVPCKLKIKEEDKFVKQVEYVCGKCNFKTMLKDALDTHKCEYVCKECNFKTSWKCSLKVHLGIHKSVQYSCNECDFVTNWKHMIKFIEVKDTFANSAVSEQFGNILYNYICNFIKVFNRHLKIHVGERYACNECNFSTIWKHCLAEHLDIHKFGQYSCKKCSFKTINKRMLQKHSKIHKDCVKKELNPESDNYHTKQGTVSTYVNFVDCGKNELISKPITHKTDPLEKVSETAFNTVQSNLKVYHCDICPYTATQRRYLKRHFKKHLEQPKFKCKVCSYETSERDDFKIHLLLHPEEKPFSCSRCQYKCKNKYTLKCHMKLHIDPTDVFVCKICNLTTPWKSSFVTHLKIHKGEHYICNECNFKTPWKSSLIKHVKIHKDDKYSCKECNFRTLWKRSFVMHVKIHINERPYTCTKCKKTFLTKYILKRHGVRVHKEQD
ncbi:hypothetical protein FQA39_LY17979 [Lamprigera yunnana]|nr:hypothetical protein FQA39_LY17979 [Lamprigera yunnana]